MKNLQRVNPNQWQDILPLAQLYQDLPNTLRCSPHKNNTDFRRKTPKRATQNAYIGYNTPNVTTFIIIDLDYDGSIFAYYDEGIPAPQFIIKNPKNGHCQYVYRLKNPVSFFKNSHQAPIDLLRATEIALNDVLGGDKGFTGYLAKNALSDAHDVYMTGSKPYTLNDLADYLDLPTQTPTTADNDNSYGRNCSIFDAVRKLAYSIASGCSYPQLYEQCLHWCEQQNEKYPDPLPYNELKSISKSIATYCKSQGYIRSLSELQAKKGAKGGKAKGKTYDSKRKQAEEMHRQGIKQKDIAEQLNVTARTLRNWGIQRKK